VAAAFAYSFFWCGAAGIYLLLRKAVDQTEFDEVFLDDDQPPFDLPPLTAAESVVPQMPSSSDSSESAEPSPETDTADEPGEAPGNSDEESSDIEAADTAEDGDDDLEADDPEEELMF